MENPNVNLLSEMKCPQCSSFGPFRIVAMVNVTVSDEGIDEDCDADFEWDGGSQCTCKSCEHIARVMDFREGAEVQA